MENILTVNFDDDSESALSDVVRAQRSAEGQGSP